MPDNEQEDCEYLIDLSDRLMDVPCSYGTDQSDCDRLLAIAEKLKEKI